MSRTFKNVEIFAVGTWNRMKFALEDLHDIAANTNALMEKGRHHPPLKLGHTHMEPEGQPALGWAENFRVSEEKLVADFVNVPDKLVEAVDETLYRQVSVEMTHIDELGWIVTAVAILGADLPAVKSLEDLQAYLSQEITPPTEPTITALVFKAIGPKISGDFDMKTAEEQQAEMQKLQALIDAQNAKIKEYEDNQRKTAFEMASEKALLSIKEGVEAGQLEPALLTKAEAEIKSQEASFKDDKATPIVFSTGLMLEFMKSERRPEGAGASNDSDDGNGDGESPGEGLAQAVNDYAAKNNVPWLTAYNQVIQRRADLVQKYVENPAVEMRDTRPVAK